MRAIVLSGGGAKGAYQIGVWKALRKLHVHYDIVTGTSVGALNGAFMVQGNYDDALWMWENMNFNLIFSQKFDEKVLEKHGTFELLKIYAKGILKNGGMDVSRMEETMDRFIHTDKFYGSNVNYGMITVNLSNLKPVSLLKKDIPSNQLRDYLMASATCFPAFKIKKIDGDMYIDGGYYDNLPINLALDMGADDVIAVDLDEIGIKRKLKHLSKNVPITYISPRNDLGNFLVFDKKLAMRGIQFGYNDAMKVFGKLEGDCYTFKRYHMRYSYLKNHRKMESKMRALLNLQDSDANKRWKKSVLARPLGLEDNNDWNDLYLQQLEFLAKALEIEESTIYSIYQFNKELKSTFHKVERIRMDGLERKILENKIFDVMNTRSLIRYVYDLILEAGKKNEHDLLGHLALVFPKEFLAALYLSVLDSSL